MKDWKLGEAIRTARMRRDLTQEQLSELLNITPGHLKHMESGKRKPSVPLLFRMMELLDLSVDALVFTDQTHPEVIHTHGLTQAEIDALGRLVQAMRQSSAENFAEDAENADRADDTDNAE
ncbi:MAG: helix-turn-helix transcriptional regulator [Firmicutes bacterium]|nr:helix-turn-helix transcriptional regulator [Bacillota bacterium]